MKIEKYAEKCEKIANAGSIKTVEERNAAMKSLVIVKLIGESKELGTTADMVYYATREARGIGNMADLLVEQGKKTTNGAHRADLDLAAHRIYAQEAAAWGWVAALAIARATDIREHVLADDPESVEKMTNLLKAVEEQASVLCDWAI